MRSAINSKWALLVLLAACTGEEGGAFWPPSGDTAAVELQGTDQGVDPEASPGVSIHCSRGPVVWAGAKLELSGAGSASENGAIAEFRWDIREQPAGFAAGFTPSDTSEDVEVTVDTPGRYVFVLRVVDVQGADAEGVYTVHVLPDEVVRVDLTWTTLGEPRRAEATDGARADVDLHYLHPGAKGLDIDDDGEFDGWFDTELDCYWDNPEPSWPGQDAAEAGSPILISEDPDGLRREIVFHPNPHALQLEVGIHYWDDFSYGVSEASVIVWLGSEAVYEAGPVMLSVNDLWEVCTIDVETGEVTPRQTEDGDPLVTGDCNVKELFR